LVKEEDMISCFIPSFLFIHILSSLFSSGCGRFFEGKPSDMWNAFTELLKLPEDTHIYFGHEYTLSNLKFAAHVEPDNRDIQDKMKWAQENKCTTPSTISNEKLTNPFLRVESIGHLIDPSCSSTTELLGKIRSIKYIFKKKELFFF
jgi:hydroxyacylglutathione hydrolase